MPCHAAMIDKPLTFPPDTKVEKALKELKKKNANIAAVVDEKGVLLGAFSVRIMMKDLLPVSVVLSNGIELDMPVSAAPGIAKRLKKVYPLAVSELMDKRLGVVLPDTPIWECINGLLHHGPALFVVDGEDKKFLGMIDEQSALAELERLLESE